MAKKIHKDNQSAGDKFMSEAMDRLHVATSPEQCLTTADLVVEAVVENLDLKRKIFSQYDQLAPEKTFFASNTSSLPIGKIATATKRLDRFGGLHFFNPVPVMKLLEVIRIPETSDETFDAMVAWGELI